MGLSERILLYAKEYQCQGIPLHGMSMIRMGVSLTSIADDEQMDLKNEE
jgi:hypothetical protein